ncbi:hypothetical protein KGQ71_00460 [Patescibacteria group bacterium]|nr:hypothetical protein [Patescibacteria group bacterium]
MSLVYKLAAATGPLNSNSIIKPGGDANFAGAAKNTDLTKPLLNIGNVVVDVLFIIAAILAVSYLVYSGIQYITSAGNPEKTKTARTAIINAVIGIIIIAATYAVIRFAINIGAGLVGATS